MGIVLFNLHVYLVEKKLMVKLKLEVIIVIQIFKTKLKN